jgi:hypothetical protein
MEIPVCGFIRGFLHFHLRRNHHRPAMKADVETLKSEIKALRKTLKPK